MRIKARWSWLVLVVATVGLLAIAVLPLSARVAWAEPRTDVPTVWPPPGYQMLEGGVNDGADGRFAEYPPTQAPPAEYRCVLDQGRVTSWLCPQRAGAVPGQVYGEPGPSPTTSPSPGPSPTSSPGTSPSGSSSPPPSTAPPSPSSEPSPPATSSPAPGDYAGPSAQDFQDLRAEVLYGVALLVFLAAARFVLTWWRP